MKKIVLLFALCFATIGFSQEDEDVSNLNWLTDLSEAQTKSETSKKPR